MATRYTQSRSQTTQIVIDGRDCGLWAKAEGGNIDSDVITYGEYPKATGVRSRDDGTYRRPYSEDDFDLELFLEGAIGKQATVIRHRFSDDGEPLGGTRTFTGPVKGFNGPDQDQTESARSEMALMIALDVDAG